MLRFPSLCAGLVAGVLFAPRQQDPPPAKAPAPAQAPAPTPAGRPARHPLEGVYGLRARIIDTRKDATECRGYLAITQRHLFLCLAAPGPNPDLPLVRTGVRTWQPDGEQVTATIALGWFTDKDGALHAEQPGTLERRRIEPIQGGVRVLQDARNWLEFERIE